mgnify:CR=1 FL=1
MFLIVFSHNCIESFTVFILAGQVYYLQGDAGYNCFLGDIKLIDHTLRTLGKGKKSTLLK